jgi:hydrogenase nickel incorporation protein HypA/HybF
VHELSIATAVLNTAVKHAGGRRVSVVSVRTGQMRQVVPESLQFYWGIVARDTVCEGAELQLDEIAAELRCEDCGHAWEPLIPAFHCPRCGGTAVMIAAGDELEVDYIEVEQEEPACTGPR